MDDLNPSQQEEKKFKDFSATVIVVLWVAGICYCIRFFNDVHRLAERIGR